MPCLAALIQLCLVCAVTGIFLANKIGAAAADDDDDE